MTKWFDSRPYETWDPIKFPIEHGTRKLSITSFDITCNHCGETVGRVRAKSYGYPSCIEVRAAGICYHCQIVQYTRFRFYPDGRLLFDKGDRWVTYLAESKPTIFDFFRRILFYLFS